MIDLNEVLRLGPLSARELVDTAGSRATLSRHLHRLGSLVVRIGRARATRYGLRRRVTHLDASELPVFEIDEEGRVRDGGRLVFLRGDVTVWQPADETYDGLPPIMADMPGIRNVLCYVPATWSNSAPIPSSGCILGNEAVFDSLDALNTALASDVRHRLREDYKSFPVKPGPNTHYAMQRVDFRP